MTKPKSGFAAATMADLRAQHDELIALILLERDNRKTAEDELWLWVHKTLQEWHSGYSAELLSFRKQQIWTDELQLHVSDLESRTLRGRIARVRQWFMRRRLARGKDE